MCLSTAYKNEVKEENIIMKNVMNIESVASHIVLTDLMERKVEIKGSIKLCNLVDNYIVIKEEKDEK